MPDFILVLFYNILWMALTLATAGLLGHMATPAQMLAQGYQKGLPFLAHGGMWGDLLLFGPIMAYVIGFHRDDIDWQDLKIMLPIGFAMSCAMHWVYTKTDFPDSLAWVGGPVMGLTAAGILHLIYMGVGFAIVGMFLFSSPSIHPIEYLVVAILLGVHIAVGNHLVLGVLNEVHHWSWCPEFLRKPDPYITIAAVCAILVVIVGIRTEIVMAGILAAVYLAIVGSAWFLAREYLYSHGNDLLA